MSWRQRYKLHARHVQRELIAQAKAWTALVYAKIADLELINPVPESPPTVHASHAL